MDAPTPPMSLRIRPAVAAVGVLAAWSALAGPALSSTELVSSGDCELALPSINSLNSTNSVTATLDALGAFAGSKGLALNCPNSVSNAAYYVYAPTGLGVFQVGHTYVFSMNSKSNGTIGVRWLLLITGGATNQGSVGSSSTSWFLNSLTYTVAVGVTQIQARIDLTSASGNGTVYVDNVSIQDITSSPAPATTWSTGPDTGVPLLTGAADDLGKLTIGWGNFPMPSSPGAYAVRLQQLASDGSVATAAPDQPAAAAGSVVVDKVASAVDVRASIVGPSSSPATTVVAQAQLTGANGSERLLGLTADQAYALMGSIDPVINALCFMSLAMILLSLLLL